MATTETTNVTSAIFVSSILQPLPRFVASEGPSAARDVGRESLEEAEPLQQLAKLDVVVRNGAE
jgi:hypothetical protein